MTKKLGIIAGAGDFPVLIAKEAKKQGFQVFTAGLKGNIDPSLEELSETTVNLKLGQINTAIKFFRQNEIKQITLAGLIKHKLVFSDFKPDLKAVKILSRLKDMRAETIIKEVIKEFEKEDIEIINSAHFLKHLLAKKGVLSDRKPNKLQLKNIEFGRRAAKKLADMDAGLTVVTADMSIVALEAMEGTDKCILRAGEIYGSSLDKTKKSSGLVVVKVARTAQDMRFDLPIIGENTILTMIKAGAETLAIEADKTLLINKEELINLANQNKISITGI